MRHSARLKNLNFKQAYVYLWIPCQYGHRSSSIDVGQCLKTLSLMYEVLVLLFMTEGFHMNYVGVIIYEYYQNNSKQIHLYLCIQSYNEKNVI